MTDQHEMEIQHLRRQNDALRKAIAYALNDPTNSGQSLEWLREWSMGDPEAMAELERYIYD